MVAGGGGLEILFGKRQLQQQQQTELDGGGSRDGLYEPGQVPLSQIPVQPVTAAAPDHSKSLEKTELFSSLFQSQEQSKGLPASTAPTNQIYPQTNYPLFDQKHTIVR
ncbi:hypothetical protein WMY93_025653 [Mugilogobius chulae]|uniref:Uncharacterized protein n=1 Tax=Mugilogobius chulae TaxID=88201 RepID=A0AAW0N7M4_9GOBI